MKMSVAELIVGSFFLLVSIIFFALSMKLPAPMNPSDLGPATFPYIIVIVIAFLSCLLIYRGLKNKNDAEQPIIKIKRKNNVFFVILLVLVYIILLPIIGYYISTALAFPAILWFAGERKPLKIVSITAGFIVFALLVFDMLLGVPLP